MKRCQEKNEIFIIILRYRKLHACLHRDEILEKEKNDGGELGSG